MITNIDSPYLYQLFIFYISSSIIQTYNKFNIDPMPNNNDVKPFLEEIMALVIDFLDKKAGEKAVANQLREKYQPRLPEWMIEGNPLIKKGLAKLIKGYIKQNNQIYSYYLNRQVEAASQEEQSLEEDKKPRKQRKISKQIQSKQANGKVSTHVNDGKHHDNTSTWVVSRFEAPRKLEEIGVEEHMKGVQVSLHKSKMVAKMQSEDEESVKPPPKKSKKRVIESQSESEVSEQKPKKSSENKKKAKVVSSESENESSESSEKPKKKSKAKPSKREQKAKKIMIKKAKQSSDSEEEKEILTKKNKPVVNLSIAENPIHVATKKPFSRINVQEIGDIPETLKDNTFEAKFKYGKGGDEWGKFGYEKLKDTRGQSFKKTKGKLKNKAFQGANIDFNAVNSIKL